jgi:hypothetical protein
MFLMGWKSVLTAVQIQGELRFCTSLLTVQAANLCYRHG